MPESGDTPRFDRMDQSPKPFGTVRPRLDTFPIACTALPAPREPHSDLAAMQQPFSRNAWQVESQVYWGEHFWPREYLLASRALKGHRVSLLRTRVPSRVPDRNRSVAPLLCPVRQY